MKEENRIQIEATSPLVTTRPPFRDIKSISSLSFQSFYNEDKPIDFQYHRDESDSKNSYKSLKVRLFNEQRIEISERNRRPQKPLNETDFSQFDG